MSEKKSCFIIMPITTPENWLEKYENDSEHFIHVLDCLFLPAIEKANLEPIRPITEGAENIHANIIKNIETADVVLCDLSIFNPNVFFELGIRTALNMPVCLVKDDLADKLPFDVGSINCHTYSSLLKSWDLKGEIGKISKHLSQSHSKSKGENPLWRYFGIRGVANSGNIDGSTEEKLSVIFNKLDSIEDTIRLNRKVDNSETGIIAMDDDSISFREEQILKLIYEGFGRKEIAQKLSLSKKTIDFYISTMIKKFDIDDYDGLIEFSKGYFD